MRERTHYSLTNATLLGAHWAPKDAVKAAEASEATDICTPSFLGDDVAAWKGCLPTPTQLDSDPKLTPEQWAVDSWYPGWEHVLAPWHGGREAVRERRPIHIGDMDLAVDVAGVRANNDPTLRNLIRLGLYMHSAQDTATHCGFVPWQDPLNARPGYKVPWWKRWAIKRIPEILHAQWLDLVDRVEGEGRDGSDTLVPTRWKIATETRALHEILGLTTDRKRIEAVVEAITTARNDNALCVQLDALCAAWAGPDWPRETWKKGAPEWREVFAVVREG